MSIFSLIQTNALFSIIRKIHDNLLKLLNYNQKLKVNIYLSCFLRAFSLNFSISFWSSLESLLPFSSASINCCWSNLFSSINVVICTSTTPLSPSLLSLLVCVCSCKPTRNRNPNNYKLNIIWKSNLWYTFVELHFQLANELNLETVFYLVSN